MAFLGKKKNKMVGFKSERIIGKNIASKE